ncbi:MAG: LysM peptidoglycan-binding domain-containing protein [Verrucomicrobiota bacterium]
MIHVTRSINTGLLSLTILGSLTFVGCSSNSNSGDQSSDIFDPSVTGYESTYGAEVIEPTTPQTTFEYTIKPGDSLWKLSREYGTQVMTIKKLNNLESDMIRVGDKLLIPGTDPSLTESAE